MSKTKILEWFSGNSASLSSDRILLYLIAALIIAGIIYITYRITYTGVSYNNKFAVTNLIILLIAATLMMMISSNIAISLGMVGALSIVRYRTAIKDPNDTLFLFWSIVEGLCVGAQMLKIAVITTLFIAIVMIAVTYIGCFRQKYLIIIRGAKEASTDRVAAAVHDMYPKNRIRTSNHTESGVEIIMEVSARGPVSEENVKAILAVPGIESVNWLLQTGENIG
ncbi:MAG: DUF4956 domain-containing protein [Eubacterium sp.]|nr:DUF4956 domain-containing protein [Eubacterium sp.]